MQRHCGNSPKQERAAAFDVHLAFKLLLRRLARKAFHLDAAGIAEIKMRKTLVTILCSALIAASSIQAAAAAGHHRAPKASRQPVIVNDQHRNSNNEQPRDSNAGGMCGIFPGPCGR
jgi:hypothetical protein